MGKYAAQKQMLKLKNRQEHKTRQEHLSEFHPRVQLFDVNSAALSMKECDT